MTQYLRPSSDINTGWSCSTGTARYALIDEEVANDADYITSTFDNSLQECGLSTGATPASRMGHILHVRIYGHLVPTNDMSLYLVQGTTVIKTAIVSKNASWGELTYELSESEAGNISNYSDLRLQFKNTTGGFSIKVSQAYLEIPDAPVISLGLEMGCSF